MGESDPLIGLTHGVIGHFLLCLDFRVVGVREGLRGS